VVTASRKNQEGGASGKTGRGRPNDMPQSHTRGREAQELYHYKKAERRERGHDIFANDKTRKGEKKIVKWGRFRVKKKKNQRCDARTNRAHERRRGNRTNLTRKTPKQNQRCVKNKDKRKGRLRWTGGPGKKKKGKGGEGEGRATKIMSKRLCRKKSHKRGGGLGTLVEMSGVQSARKDLC